MAQNFGPNTDRIIICTGCSGGADLARAVSEFVSVETCECMNMCGKPVSVAVRSERKAAYLFSGVDPKSPEDIAAFAKLYAEAPTGEITDARTTGSLRFCLVGRIPA